jgi:hypothetical protein
VYYWKETLQPYIDHTAVYPYTSAVFDGHTCPGRDLDVRFHDQKSVRESRCTVKCVSGTEPGCALAGTCAGSSGICAAPQDLLLCGTRADLELACATLSECKAWSMVSDGANAVAKLHSGGCEAARTAAATGDPVQLLIKADPPQPSSCPLGVGVELVDGPFPAIKGLYELKGSVYEHPAYHRIIKRSDDCGWSVEEWSAGTISSPADPTCTDENIALNWMLKQCGTSKTSPSCEDSVDYEPDLCATLVSVYDQGGLSSYCHHSDFRGICAASCGISNCQVDLPGCSGHCEDPVDIALCKKTCARRRLEDLLPLEVPASRRLTPQARQLSGGSYFEVLRTCPVDAATRPGGCAAECPADLLGGSPFYDVNENVGAIAAAAIVHECAGRSRYTLAETNAYCSLKNINTLNHPNPTIVESNCKRKCGDWMLDAAERTSDSAALTGFADFDAVAPDPLGLQAMGAVKGLSWCSGNGGSLDVFSTTGVVDNDAALALCLPREACEAACDMLEDCVSIDMHRTLPRCYLNTLNASECAADGRLKEDRAYDLIEKAHTHDETSNVLDDVGRISFATHSRVHCAREYVVEWPQREILDVANNTMVNTTRDVCESLCVDDHSCAGFQFTHEIESRYQLDWGVEWTANFESLKNIVMRAVTTDGTGNFYLAGLQSQTFSNASAENTGYLVSVAPDQTVRWQMEVYADSTVELHGLAVGNDNVYAVGVSYGRAKYYGGINSTGMSDCLMVIASAKDGSLSRVIQFGSSRADVLRGVTVLPDGFVGVGYTAGNWTRSEDNITYERCITYTPNRTNLSLTNCSNVTNITPRYTMKADGLVAKRDLLGNELWTRQYGTNYTERFTAVANASNGDFVVSGYTYGCFPCYRVPGEGCYIDTAPNCRFPPEKGGKGSDALVLRLDGETGDVVWVAQFGTNESDVLTSVAFLRDQTVTAAGYTFGRFEGFENAGDADALIASMPFEGAGPGDGEGVRVLQFGSQMDEVLRGLVLGPDGSVFVAGEPAPFDFVSQQDAVGPAAGRRRATLKDRITAYHAGLPITRRLESRTNRRRMVGYPTPAPTPKIVNPDPTPSPTPGPYYNIADRIAADAHWSTSPRRRYENRRRNLVIPWPDYTWPGLSAANKSLCQIPPYIPGQHSGGICEEGRFIKFGKSCTVACATFYRPAYEVVGPCGVTTNSSEPKYFTDSIYIMYNRTNFTNHTLRDYNVTNPLQQQADWRAGDNWRYVFTFPRYPDYYYYADFLPDSVPLFMLGSGDAGGASTGITGNGACVNYNSTEEPRIVIYPKQLYKDSGAATAQLNIDECAALCGQEAWCQAYEFETQDLQNGGNLGHASAKCSLVIADPYDDTHADVTSFASAEGFTCCLGDDVVHVIAADYYGKPEADLLHGWEPGAGSIYSHCFLKKVEVYDDYPTFWKVYDEESPEYQTYQHADRWKFYQNHTNLTGSLECIPGCIPPTSFSVILGMSYFGACAEGDFIDVGHNCTTQCEEFLTPSPARITCDYAGMPIFFECTPGRTSSSLTLTLSAEDAAALMSDIGVAKARFQSIIATALGVVTHGVVVTDVTLSTVSPSSRKLQAAAPVVYVVVDFFVRGQGAGYDALMALAAGTTPLDDAARAALVAAIGTAFPGIVVLGLVVSPPTAQVGRDAFVSQVTRDLQPAGLYGSAVQWTLRLLSDVDDGVSGIAMDYTGALMVSGRTHGTMGSEKYKGFGAKISMLSDRKYHTLPNGLCQFETYDTVIEEGELSCPVLYPPELGHEFLPDGRRQQYFESRKVERTTAFVQKLPYAQCSAAVSGVGAPNGVYIRDEQRKAQYLRIDNAYRLRFAAGSTGHYGWLLEKNMLEHTSTLAICDDAPEAAEVWLSANYTRTEAQRFPCQHAKDTGRCGDVIVAGLCARSCSPMVEFEDGWGLRKQYLRTVGFPSYMEAYEVGYKYQTPALYEDLGDVNSTCDGDNNFGFHAFLTATRTFAGLSSVPEIGSCYALLRAPDVWWDATLGDEMIVPVLCKASWPSAAFSTVAPTTETPTLYPGVRQLLTTSLYGKLPNTAEASFFDAEVAVWDVEFRTYPSDYQTYPTPPLGPPPDQSVYDEIPNVEWYDTEASVAPSGATIQHVCRKDSMCPSLTTCVMTPARMMDEMQIFRGTVPRSAYLMTIDGPQKDFFLEERHFVSKALVSAARAEAFLHAHVKSYFMPVLHRAAVGATRMQVDGLSSVGQYFVTSLFEAGDGDEAGRTYELGAAAAHYEPGFSR